MIFHFCSRRLKIELVELKCIRAKNVTKNHSLKPLGRKLDGFQLFNKFIPKLCFTSSFRQWHKSENQLLILIFLLKTSVSNNLKLVKTSQTLLWDDTLELYTKVPLFAQQQLKTRALYIPCNKAILLIFPEGKFPSTSPGIFQ